MAGLQQEHSVVNHAMSDLKEPTLSDVISLLSEMNNGINGLKEKVEKNSKSIASMQKSINGLTEKVDNNSKSIAKLANKINETNKMVRTNSVSLGALVEDSARSKLRRRFGDVFCQKFCIHGLPGLAHLLTTKRVYTHEHPLGGISGSQHADVEYKMKALATYIVDSRFRLLRVAADRLAEQANVTVSSSSTADILEKIISARQRQKKGKKGKKDEILKKARKLKKFADMVKACGEGKMQKEKLFPPLEDETGLGLTLLLCDLPKEVYPHPTHHVIDLDLRGYIGSGLDIYDEPMEEDSSESETESKSRPGMSTTTAISYRMGEIKAQTR